MSDMNLVRNAPQYTKVTGKCLDPGLCSAGEILYRIFNTFLEDLPCSDLLNVNPLITPVQREGVPRLPQTPYTKR